ncbi:MAG TPA: HK97-gp10 family putative phage morphogenesis protein [Paracoccus sp. (in: a-proteobacteria)]|uniref:HK97-gp10 family putative phage morphogenesis protein n=1 Tax=Paracoccus sp. TaxID=267 RepID=UPI002C10F611|nr:HK97-gp10 family putative phage morphogenesis protein [Paracoccus sp. (in: a-proteobacteria)]HWL56535.1 HK97-gp10 family putative phage morphogenesis protein [Paracoccus sp. (in: a-proteobacteria)]
MAKMVQGSEAIIRKMKAMRDAAAPVLRPMLVKAGEEIAADMRALAESSRRTGDLIESIHVTGPGETTPAHSTDGGQRTAGEFEVLVTAGDTDARHAHLVEGGTKPRLHKDGTTTGTMPAQPFFNPAWRLNRTRLQARINRLLRKAMREASQ